MRKVLFSSVPTPEILTSDDAAQARSEVATFLGKSDLEKSTRRAPYNERLVRDKAVIEALHTLFRGKCGYCESRDSVDVEHHRPRANASSARKSFPDHYSWLAYDWENLLLICGPCNRRKATRFPLRGGRAKPLDELDQIRAQESPELLDPGYDRPERHLDFTLDGTCHALTKRGAATIEMLDLNRAPLIETRHSTFEKLAARVKAAGKPDDVLKAMLAIGPDDPHAGALLILRHNYATELARLRDHFTFSFDDTRGLLGRLHAGASMETVRNAFATLEKPRAPTHLKAPATIAEVQAWRGFSPAIRRVEIRNFKGIRSLDLDFAERRIERSGAVCMMILGENATGKSSIIEAMAIALVGSKTANTGLGLKPRDVKQMIHRPVPGEEVSPEPTRITVSFVEGAPAEVRIPPSGTAFEGTEEPSVNVQAYGSRRFFLRGRRKRVRSGGMRGLFDPLWVLPHPDLWLSKLDEGQFYQVARALREILSLPDATDIRRDPEDGVMIVSEIEGVDDAGNPVKLGKHEISIQQHSEGYRSLSATAVDAMRAMMGTAPDLAGVEGVVLIDEIETHLHPRWKMRIMSALRSALPKVQFIATTHDPLCLRGMDDGEVQVLIRNQNQIERLTGLPSVRGMRAEQLLTSEFFGLGSTDPETEAKVVRYQDLATKQELSPAEATEKRQLSEEIHKDIKVGDTFAEQVVAEALQRADIDPFRPITKVKERSREEMVKSLLGEIEQLRSSFAQPDR